MSMEYALADLATKVGTETHIGDWLTVTQEMIDQFAVVTKDEQWIHIDPERAKAESPFGTTVAHGFLTLSLVPYLTGGGDDNMQSYPGVKLGVNYGLNKVRFPHPVLVGSQIRARTHLASFHPVRGGIQIVNNVIIEIEDTPKPACAAEMVVRLYF